MKLQKFMDRGDHVVSRIWVLYCTPKMSCKYEVERVGVCRSRVGRRRRCKIEGNFYDPSKNYRRFGSYVRGFARGIGTIWGRRNNDGGGKGSGSGCIEIWVKGNNDNKSEIDRKRAKKIEEAEECVEKILRGSNEWKTRWWWKVCGEQIWGANL